MWQLDCLSMELAKPGEIPINIHNIHFTIEKNINYCHNESNKEFMEGESMDSKKLKVLVVDDEAVNRELLKKYLCQKYEVIEAVDGEDAIEKIKAVGIELSMILLDVIMPKKDGFEVLEYLNRYNYIEEVPVILITADKQRRTVL